MAGKKWSRREFLEHSGLAMGILVAGCSGPPPTSEEANILLRATADVVLPSTLSSEDKTKACERFWSWVESYESDQRRVRVRELPRTVKLPSPSPKTPKNRYLYQLKELSEMSEHQFHKLSVEKREKLIRGVLEDVVPSDATALPWPAALVKQPEDHVALALASHFLYSRQGRNLAEGAEVDAFTCQTLDNLNEPLRVD